MRIPLPRWPRLASFRGAQFVRVLLEKQHSWRPIVAQALAERGNSSGPERIPLEVNTSAMVCLSVALDHWTASGGQRDASELLDKAFSVFAAQ